jgi:hypothetical protein
MNKEACDGIWRTLRGAVRIYTHDLSLPVSRTAACISKMVLEDSYYSLLVLFAACISGRLHLGYGVSCFVWLPISHISEFVSMFMKTHDTSLDT